jgi:thiamine pyrophosphokinase
VKAVIVAGGAHAPSDQRALDTADMVIAADGGTRWLDTLGRAPDRVIGDLDSSDPALIGRLADAGVPVERHPTDKDASDLELSVAAAVEAGADELVVLGGLGGDLDHLAANLLLLGSPLAEGRAMRLALGRTSARMLVGPVRGAVAGPAGTRVTLLAVGEAAGGITTRGLRWPLGDAHLDPGSSLGLANLVTQPPAEVWVEVGRVLLIEIEPDPVGGEARP